MSTAVVSRPANMPGYNNSADLEEVQSLSRDPPKLGAMEQDLSEPDKQNKSYKILTGITTVTNEPSTDLLNGSSWAATADGPQNFQDFPDNGSAGETDEYIFTSGQTTPRGSRLDHSQATEAVWANSRTASSMAMGPQAMSRVDSSRSSGSSMSRTSHLSNTDTRGNASAYRTGPHTSDPMAGMDSCLLLEPDANTIPSQMYWPDYTLDLGLTADSGAFPLSNTNPLHVVPADMHLGLDSTLPDNSSPSSWDFSSSISRASSPATIDEAWLPAPLSPNPSPKIKCQSPSAERNLSVMSNDPNGPAMPKLEDTLGLSPPYTIRRLGNEGESARDHHLYKNVAPKTDGLFHCPWEGDASCNHKPEKLKCNYDKFVDSHLKPYRCKAESCEGARFSSTACLLRHEREAHGLHGHGDKPFLCVYQGCERAIPGNGFPRQWNLRDHMKRVHNDHGSAGGSPPPTPVQQQQPTKGRKRKTEVPEPQATSSRKASIKSMPAAEEKGLSPRPLLDQWVDQRRAVESIFRGLQKPEDSKNLQHIAEMQTRLAAMAKMTSDLSGIPKTDTSSAGSRKAYTSGG